MYRKIVFLALASIAPSYLLLNFLSYGLSHTSIGNLWQDVNNSNAITFSIYLLCFLVFAGLLYYLGRNKKIENYFLNSASKKGITILILFFVTLPAFYVPFYGPFVFIGLNLLLIFSLFMFSKYIKYKER